MRLTKKAQALIAVGLVVGCLFGYAVFSSLDQKRTLALLVADGTSDDVARIWTQAALEEGVQLEVVSASQFLRARHSEQNRYAGIVVPDTIHQRASNYLTDTLRSYVKNGGKLMLVFDALTYDLNGAYSESSARLSDVIGVDYAMYEKFGKEVVRTRPVIGTADSVMQIGIPPGRTEIQQPVTLGTTKFDRWMTTYRYKELQYPLFQTGTVAEGTKVILLTPESQVVAAKHTYGKGNALFVNLPLGLLKNSTDGLLLHSFLRYFSDEFVGLPRLLSAPDGIGGLILNIHVDNGSAIKSLDTLQKMGIFEQGPYSIHFTAGPDVNQIGDGFGMDAAHNKITQKWIRYLQARGHAIGNHGGWIHNYFGTNINESNRTDYEKFLVLNNDTMQAVTGKAITEYSAPIGNQPDWVTNWIGKHGMETYYTTSNLGMGPTRKFRDGVLVDKLTWSIPITPFGRIASFEEAMFAKQPAGPMSEWLVALTNFVADNKTIRQIYCHPIGVPYYRESMNSLLYTARILNERHQFKWRTMTEVARFMTRREGVQWQLTEQTGRLELDARHTSSLAEMTWRIPARLCGDLRITHGTGSLTRERSGWQVTAGNVRRLTISCTQPTEEKKQSTVAQH
ncbi:polysaccharide deacetylase family protein [Actimicrobium antarcticum]|uniref:NodB homology domain-containing protein n=1 Tax=Actimicrobium antarcticum TaxID=1051899 RepID=A0ABP7TM52_9BURK